MNQELFNFYTNKGETTEGFTFDEIIAWDNFWWDRSHKFIQWLFPLPEKSIFNPHAPLLDLETIAELERNEEFQNRFKDALYRYMVFLEEEDWLQTNNHNLMRISRVIRSANILGFPRVARIWCRKYGDLVRAELGNHPCLEYWERHAYEIR